MWTINSEGVLESDLLKQLPWLFHGFGTRLSAEWPGGYTQLKQIHSDIVFTADHRSGCIGEGDALITATPGQVEGIRTADCVPVLLVDPETRVVAAVHAGWRGTAAEIALRTVDRMNKEYGCEQDRMLAAIGPSIGECCFAVGPEVAAHFRPYFPDANNLTHINLPEANFRQLVGAGLDARFIERSDLCTVCDASRFHSFRRDKHLAGRMVAAIAIQG